MTLVVFPVVAMIWTGLAKVVELMSSFCVCRYGDEMRERGGEGDEVEDGALCGLLSNFSFW